MQGDYQEIFSAKSHDGNMFIIKCTCGKSFSHIRTSESETFRCSHCGELWVLRDRENTIELVRPRTNAGIIFERN